MAQTVTLHDGYVAMVFFGEVTATSVREAGGLDAEAAKAVRRHGRVLFNFDRVESFGFDPFLLGEGMKRLAEQGLRLAICSSKPAWFGVGRQIAQYSGSDGVAISVFTEEQAAVSWLLVGVTPKSRRPGTESAPGSEDGPVTSGTV